MSQRTPTDKEAHKYAAGFIKDGKKTENFKHVFPKTKAKGQSLPRAAFRFHNSSVVLNKIIELQAISRKNSNEEFELDVSKIKQLLVLAAKKGLRDKKDAKGRLIAAENISGTVSALSEINKMDGNHAAIKTESYGPNGGPLPPQVNITTNDPVEAAKAYQKIIQQK